jgi:hypothetical protein
MQPEGTTAISGGESTPVPDVGEAINFIDLLTGDADQPVTFQAFPEGGAKGVPQHFHGTILDCWNRIEKLNAEGQGIFVPVNETDGKGRKAENVTALRALVADDDAGTLDPDTLAVKASLVVESSPGKSHTYWFLLPGEPLEAFTPAQAAIAAKLGTDPAVKDLPRVLRLPGTIHRKDPSNPFLVRVLSANPERRSSIAGILSGLDASPAAPAAPPSPSPAPTPTALAPRILSGGGADPKARARAWMLAAPAAGQGERDSKCYSMACDLSLGFLLPDSDAADIGREYGARCHPPADDLWESKWIPNAKRSGLQPRGGLLNATMPDAPRTAPRERETPTTTINTLAAGWCEFTEEELKIDPQPQEFLWERRIPAGKVGTLAGAGGGGKTSLIVGLCIHRASGSVYLGKPTRQGTTTILSTEDAREDYLRKFAAWRIAHPFTYNAKDIRERVKLLDLSGIPFQLVEGRHGIFEVSRYVDALLALLRDKAPETDLLVIETLARMGGDESNPAMSALIKAAEEIRKATGATVLYVHHHSKAGVREGITDGQAPRGGVSLVDGGRFTVNISRPSPAKAKPLIGFEPTPEQARDLLLMEFPKMTGALEGEAVILQRTVTRFGITVSAYKGSEAEEGDRRDATMARAHHHGTALSRVIAELVEAGEEPNPTPTYLSKKCLKRLGIKKDDLPAAIGAAEVEGYIHRVKAGQGGGWVLRPGRGPGESPPPPPSSPVPSDKGGAAQRVEGEREKLSPTHLLGTGIGDSSPAPIQTGFLGAGEVRDVQ